MSGKDQSGLGTHYEFFPSVRAGYRPSQRYGTEPLQRPAFGVDLTVEGKQKGGDWEEAEDQPSTDIRLYGPGDVAGIDERQVVRVEPEPDTSTMPPNYFPLVEFDRADLPWLFSPERANPDDDAKVRPWLALVVVEKTNEAVSVEADGRKPLPALSVPQNELPPVTEVWAWAHVQVTGTLTDGELKRVFTGTSDQAVARLLCPRNLDPNTRYVAAVVPTFEPGRRVGLGKQPYESDAEQPTVEPAWDASKESTTTLPIYHQWEFATANEGDFESLARKLEPRQLSEAGVGKREVDLSDPGPPQLEDRDSTFEVGGALMSPGLDQQPLATTKREAMRRLLNDPDSTDTDGTGRSEATSSDGQSEAESDPQADLPVIGPSIYGQWYLPGDAGWGVDDGRPTPPDVPTSGPYVDAWLRELNVDPRWRIPAGYGTEVIQENQERLMEAAWEKFGDLELANERTGRSQLGDLAGSNVRDRFERAGDHLVGVSSRVRDIEQLHREIVAAGRLRDEGALGGHDPDPAVGEVVEQGDDVRAKLGERQFADTLTRQGKLAVSEETKSITSTQGKRKLNELRLGASGGPMRGDGAGALGAAGGTLADPRALNRAAKLASPTFRRLTRSKGKLDRGVSTDAKKATFTERMGESFSFDTERKLGGRFARVSDELPEREASSESSAQTATEAAESADTENAKPASTDGESTDWRLGSQGQVLSLSEAVDELDGKAATVPKALLAVESAREHCTTARQRLDDLDSALAENEGEFTTDAVAAVTERPTVEDHCDAIKRNTFDTLDRQFRKLLAADPAALSPEFTTESKTTELEGIREAHGRLAAAAEHVTDAITSQSDELATVRGKIDAALAAIADIEDGLDALAGAVDSGIPAGATRTATTAADTSAVADAAATTEQVASQPIPLAETSAAVDQQGVLEEFTTVQKETLLSGTSQYPGLLDAGSWAKQRAAWDVHPSMTDREVELGPILAAPEFEQPMYRWLKALDQQYLLPGVGKIPKDTVGALQTNSAFVESFMCGLNHEMARELQWRRYPTDRRGTYFRQFWKYLGSDQKDVTKLHTWGDSALGENRAAGVEDDRVVLLIRGDLLRAYPNTRIYAVKAVKEDKDEGDDTEWDRVPLLPSLRAQAVAEIEDDDVSEDERILGEYSKTELNQSAWDPKEPVFSGKLDPDITFFGFDLTTTEAEGGTIAEGTDDEDLGWFFVLEERVGETRFGYDVASRGDYGSKPYGIDYGPEGNRSTNTMGEDAHGEGAEKGWNGLSWGHLVESEEALEGKKYVRVTEDAPAGGSDPAWAVTEGTEWNEVNDDEWHHDDAAEWGKNSAHMARIAWQLPVRICIHGDDILPEMSGGSGRYRIAADLPEVTLDE
ncbi:hypothetical protein [Halorientalis pallida]|uniref:Uncharacterized protein n=1 Tax=Halorientalis pallida TaxID=2479928 RepID=A0A498KXL5_9EURY|nr:hypothetical protein [Halorientalis pallida]RXK48653.1 hypothetical protein EAF64_13345 [Halorientalis pallida]